MNIKEGQTWSRINPMHGNEMYFPKKGWKVRILKVANNVVTHELVEYNGEKRDRDLRTSHFIDDFLSMYELVEEE